MAEVEGKPDPKFKTPNWSTLYKTEGRPAAGWGVCEFKDPVTKATCTNEKWCDRGPFCRPHMDIAKKRKVAKRKQDKLDFQSACEEKAQASVAKLINLADKCDWKSIDDVIVFTRELGKAVVLGVVDTQKARGLLSVARVAIKAFDSKYLILKLSAIIKATQTGQMDGDEAYDALADVMGEPTEAASMQVHDGAPRSMGLVEVAERAARVLEMRNRAHAGGANGSPAPAPVP